MGEARELCYQFKGRHGLNLGLNAKLEPVMLDIDHLAIAFAKGGDEFLGDLSRDTPRLETARERARSFFRWGTVCGD